MSDDQARYDRIIELIHELDKGLEKTADKDWIGAKLDEERDLMHARISSERDKLDTKIEDREQEFGSFIAPGGQFSLLVGRVQTVEANVKWAFIIAGAIFTFCQGLVLWKLTS